MTSFAENIHFLPPKPHRARRLAIALLAITPLLFGALAVALGQDANWDLRNYHWYNAYAFLNNRYGMDLLPSQTPYFYNPTLDIPFYLLATHVPAIVAGFILGTVQGLNFILLFMLAHAALVVPNPRHKVIVCSALAALGILGGGGIALLGTTFYDNVTSLGLFASALMVLANYRRLFDLPSVRAIFLALLTGIPAGLMMGLKLPSVVFCVGLCFALLLVGGDAKRRVAITFGFGCGILIGALITLGHWMFFLQAHFGSPLFPYFNEIFKSPLAPPSSARDIQFVPNNWYDRIFYPFVFVANTYRVGEILWRDLRLPILYGLLPLALVLRLCFGRSKTRPDNVAVSFVARYLLWAAAISYFAWMLMFSVYRYIIPLEMLAPLLIVIASGFLPLKLQTRGLIAALLLVIIAITIQPGNWYRRASWSEQFVSAKIPSLGDTSNLMILMAGYEPYSHLVPAFPPAIPFVRIESNFASPGEDKGINRLIHERVDGHKGRFLMLIPAWQKALANEALSYFRLALGPDNCQRVTDGLYDDKPMLLCPVTRE